MIVIRSDREHAIARATPKIVARFDPRKPTGANPSGYAYEGYFLVAEDGRDIGRRCQTGTRLQKRPREDSQIYCCEDNKESLSFHVLSCFRE